MNVFRRILVVRRASARLHLRERTAPSINAPLSRSCIPSWRIPVRKLEFAGRLHVDAIEIGERGLVMESRSARAATPLFACSSRIDAFDAQWIVMRERPPPRLTP